MKKKIIVYGLGKAYENAKTFLKEEFDLLAYSDKEWKKFLHWGGVISPREIKNYPYDYIYITSQKYVEEIKKELIEKYGIKEEKFLTIKDMWWYIQNGSVRDKWIIQKLKEIPDGLTLLDAGAGNMPYKRYCSHLRYISQDFGKYDDSKHEVGLHPDKEWISREADIISDIVNMPLNNDAIDAILCSEVFEHIKNPIRALQEFARILKSNGTLLLTVPFCSLTHMAPFYYTNGFSKYWYEDNLKEVGFEILDIVQYGNWFTYMMQELERFPYMAEKYGKGIDDNMREQIMRAIKLLMEQNEEDKGSDEVLCFGYMVKARKI